MSPDKNEDEEKVYKLAAVMGQNGGLKMVLERLGSVGNLVSGKPLFVSLLRLLQMCVKVKVNRVKLLEPEENSISCLLDALNMVRIATCISKKIDAILTLIVTICFDFSFRRCCRSTQAMCHRIAPSC